MDRMPASARILATLLATATPAAAARAGTIEVPGDHPTIQAAIDAAADGDVVLVAPGTYTANLRLGGVAVTLASRFHTTGERRFIDETVLDGGGGAAVIDIAADAAPETTIVGFTLRNADDGVMARGHFRFLDNRVTNTKDGIDYEDRAGGLVRGCVFEANRDDGLDLDDETEVLIERNTIRDNGQDGIEIRLHDHDGPPLTVVIRDNVISGNGEDGIQLIDYKRPSARVFRIEGNVFAYNRMAAVGMMCCRVTDEDYQAAQLAERIEIVGNTFIGNTYGVCGGGNTVVHANIFVATRYAALKRVGGESIVTNNLFHDNGSDYVGSNVDEKTVRRGDPRLDEGFRPAAPSDVGAFRGEGPDPGHDGAAPPPRRFAQQAPVAAGRLPETLALRDVDGDGRVDLVVPASGDHRVSVRRGAGDGSFADAAAYATARQPEAVAIADLDGDGDVDMAIANTGDDSVSILLNRGDGSFVDHVIYAVGGEPEALVAADLNGDDAIDLAAANNADETLTILYNAGDGTFGERSLIRVGRDPEAVAAADLDGDGRPDLVVVNSRDHAVSVHRNEGAKRFTAPLIYQVGRKPEDVAIVDLDGDGHLDLVVADSGGGTISILPGRGDGTFGAATTRVVGREPESIAVCDLDGDGRPDVAVANASSGTVSVLLNTGGKRLATPLTYRAGRTPKALAAADLNGDGRADLAVADNETGEVIVLLTLP